jgi:hypothetical protein
MGYVFIPHNITDLNTQVKTAVGVPAKGKSYVLFLKREEAGDFTILTGYELSNGLVTPLDGEEGSTFPFNYYDGVVEAQFMQDLKSAI